MAVLLIIMNYSGFICFAHKCGIADYYRHIPIV